MGKDRTSVKLNFIYNSIYQVLLIICPLITAPYVSRVLGAEKIGEYSYTHSFAYYFVILILLGVNNYGNRSCAAVRDNKEKLSKTFWEIYGLQLIVGISVSTIYYIYAIFLGGDLKVLMFYQGIYVISSVFDINWLFFGLEQFKITVSRNIIIKIITVILTFVLIKEPEDIGLYTILMTLGALITQISLWPFLKGRVSFRKPSIRGIFSHLLPNLILFIPVVAISLYKYMDKLMLGAMSSMTQVGYYENTEKIINIPSGFITALGTVMLPRMSNIVSNNGIDAGKKTIEKSMEFANCMSCAMAFGIASISSKFVPLYLGEEFSICSDLAVYMSVTIIFVSWANVLRTQYLIPCKKDKQYIISIFAGAIVNLFINYMLIKKYGAMGAVVGTIFAEATVCICQTFLVRRDLPIKNYFKRGIPYFVIGCIMYLSVRMLELIQCSPVICLILQVIIGSVVYVLVAGTYIRIFRKELYFEVVNMIKRFWKRDH